jgi:hypothetical protein
VTDSSRQQYTKSLLGQLCMAQTPVCHGLGLQQIIKSHGETEDNQKLGSNICMSSSSLMLPYKIADRNAFYGSLLNLKIILYDYRLLYVLTVMVGRK